MEERIIIERKSNKSIGAALLIIALGITIPLFFIMWFVMNANAYYFYSKPTMIDTLLSEDFFIIVGVALIPLLLGLLFYFWFANNQLTVTDKRIYGKVAFGKRVDLPLDSISAVAMTIVLFYGLSVSTSSGRITFYLIPKRNEVHKAISDLIIERQNKSNETVIKQEIPQSNADELKKFKELLDSGVITQEEFDQKKKQLLGL